jgi:MEMO1 family protein
LIGKFLSTKPPGLSPSIGGFKTMHQDVDEAEHSLELHLPYIHRLLQLQYPGRPTSEYPPLVPIMVGNTTPETEHVFGALLLQYLRNPSNAFIISSDFCHWGSRFHYTYYVPHARQQIPALPLSHDHLPQPPADEKTVTETIHSVFEGRPLHRHDNTHRTGAKIYDSISAVDLATMQAITTGKREWFLDTIERTGNTVCGRHPIGVIMAALEQFAAESGERGRRGHFHFIRYERSSDVEEVSDSSVSYVSAFAVL